MKAPRTGGLLAALPVALLLLTVHVCLANDGSLARIERSGTLRLGICDEDFPPFSFRAGSGWAGYDIDLAVDLANDLGVSLEIITDPNWEGLVDMVRDGRADIGMSSLSIAPERTRKTAFSRPYIYQRQGILADQLALAKLAGDSPIKKLDAAEAVIAVRTGSIYREFLPEFLPHATIREYPSWEDCYAAVKKGEATGVIGDEGQLLSWMGRNKGDSMRLVPVLFDDKRDPIGIAVASENVDLLDYINAFLLHRPQAVDIQSLYWQYKNDSDAEAGGQTARDKIPAAEYPALIVTASLAALMLAYLALLSLRGNRRK